MLVAVEEGCGKVLESNRGLATMKVGLEWSAAEGGLSQHPVGLAWDDAKTQATFVHRVWLLHSRTHARLGLRPRNLPTSQPYESDPIHVQGAD